MAPVDGSPDDRRMTGTSSGGGDISATWQGLAQVPQLLTDVKTGVLALRSLISTPAAAVATGSPIAGGAIWMLGAQLGVFLAETVQAIDDDIDGLRSTLANYQRTEDQLTTVAGHGERALAALPGAAAPSLNGGVQSCTARGVLAAAASVERPATTVAAGARWASDGTEAILSGGSQALGTAGTFAGRVLGSNPGTAPHAVAVQGATWLGQNVLEGAAWVVDGVGDSVASVADAAARWGDNAEQLATLQGACAPGARP